MSDPIYLLDDGGTEVYLVTDPRGPSTDYEPYSLQGVNFGCIVWTEGVRKDRTAMRGDYREAIDKALAGKAETFFAPFDRFELELPVGAVDDIAQSGARDAEVAHWAPRITRPEECTPEKLAQELSEYGAWEPEELADDAANWERIVWIAACNVAEEREE